MAGVSYAVTNAQSAPVDATLNGASAQVAIRSLGLTTPTYAATDIAGYVEVGHTATFVIGSGMSCLLSTPGFAMPSTGSVQVAANAAPVTPSIRPSSRPCAAASG